MAPMYKRKQLNFDSHSWNLHDTLSLHDNPSVFPTTLNQGCKLASLFGEENERNGRLSMYASRSELGSETGLTVFFGLWIQTVLDSDA